MSCLTGAGAVAPYQRSRVNVSPWRAAQRRSLGRHEFTMITTGPIEVFFKPPADTPSTEGDCLLYHLRADLESLYGREDIPWSVSPSHALLATTGILNGIDYLSQAYSAKTRQRERFTQTLRELQKRTGGLR